MHALRSVFTASPLAALVVLFAALALRLMVPAGFMPVIEGGRILLTPCSGYGQMPLTVPSAAPNHAGMMHMAMPEAAMAQHHGDSHHPVESDDSQRSCAFADLSLPLVGGADAIQLAAAILFIVATALFLRKAPPVQVRLRLRPPLRAPPRLL